MARMERAAKIMQNPVPKYMKKEEEKIEPGSQIEEITLGDNVPIGIGSQLSNERRRDMIELLRKNINIFTESPNTISGISRDLIEYHLEVNPNINTCLVENASTTSRKKRGNKFGNPETIKGKLHSRSKISKLTE